MSAVVLPQPADHGEGGDRPASDRSEPRSADKWVAGVLSLVMIGAVLSPIVENWRERPQDSFPLSYYRMFSEPRAEVQRLNYVVGIDAQGNRHTIPYQVIGAGGMNQVRRQINKIVARGDAAQLCQSVSSRVARRRDQPYAGLDTLQVISGTYELTAYFTGDKAPRSERVQASCRIRRASR